jgi:putative ABC transport system ATP-binding protein
MIKVQNLDKIYNISQPNSFTALKQINLEVKENELIILKGVSGSGKSTLLSIISSFSKPTSGLVEVMGEKVAKLPDSFISKFRSEHIGFVFQSFNLFEELSVRDNLIAPLVGFDIEDEELEVMLEDSLKVSNLSHKINQKVKTLSGGEKQRCAIARAIINDPSIILCDEPTANLDKQNSENFIEIIKSLKNMGKTILIATHDTIFDDLDIVDKTVELKNGEIVV